VAEDLGKAYGDRFSGGNPALLKVPVPSLFLFLPPDIGIHLEMNAGTGNKVG
jgi:hypothetical protein